MPKAKIRTCVVCGQKFERSSLLRFVRTPKGVVIDQKGRMPGRGAYTCLDHTEVESRRLQRALERTLRVSVDSQAASLLAKDYTMLCVAHSDVQ